MGSGLYLFAITPMKIKDYDFSSGNGHCSPSIWVTQMEKVAIRIFAVISAISIAMSL